MYISGMLMYMGTLDFEVPGGVAIRRRPLMRSTYHSPQVFEKLWPFMEADGNRSNVVLGNKYQSKLLEIIDAKWNVSAPATRPNPQGSYKYGQINVTASYMLKNKPPMIINGTLRTTLNGISYFAPTIPLRLADQYKVQGIYTLDFPSRPLVGPPQIGTSVINGTYKGFMEVIFQNNDTAVQSYHMDGYAFFFSRDGFWGLDRE